MARPIKWRKIEHIPALPYFVPSETDMAELPENILKLEELEAIRLKDLVKKILLCFSNRNVVVFFESKIL